MRTRRIDGSTNLAYKDHSFYASFGQRPINQLEFDGTAARQLQPQRRNNPNIFSRGATSSAQTIYRLTQKTEVDETNKSSEKDASNTPPNNGSLATTMINQQDNPTDKNNYSLWGWGSLTLGAIISAFLGYYSNISDTIKQPLVASSIGLAALGAATTSGIIMTTPSTDSSNLDSNTYNQDRDFSFAL